MNKISITKWSIRKLSRGVASVAIATGILLTVALQPIHAMDAAPTMTVGDTMMNMNKQVNESVDMNVKAETEVPMM